MSVVRRGRRAALSLSSGIAAAFLVPAVALASLSLVQPNPSSPATFAGNGGVSSDGYGGGSAAPNGTLQVELPAGSTIANAYLYSAGTPSSPAPTSIAFAGQTVPVATVVDGGSGVVTRGDVTAIVSSGVNPAGGTFSFDVTQPSGTEGVALVVTYSNPAEPYRTVAVLDGAAAPTGDSATFAFASPIDPTAPGFDATLALGITFSYQGGTAHECGGGQVSTVDINGVRLSSCAGNWDDGAGANNALITVGGVGDSIGNPPDPNGSGGEDDELYDLVPYLSVGDTSVQITSANPSGDDYIFLAVISITAEADVYEDGEPVPTATPTPDPTATPVPTESSAPASSAPASSAPAASTAPSQSPDEAVAPHAEENAELPDTAVFDVTALTPLAVMIATLIASVAAALAVRGWLEPGSARR